MKNFVLPAEQFTNEEAFYDHVARVFDFPEHFGRNLDALADCLSDPDLVSNMELPCRIVWIDSEKCGIDPERKGVILQIFREFSDSLGDPELTVEFVVEGVRPAVSFSDAQASQGDSNVREILKRVRSDLDTKGYESDYASFLLPDAREYLEGSRTLAETFSDVSALAVVGIGGSNLGTMAIAEAIEGRLAPVTGDKKLFFIDTVDSKKTSSILRELEKIHAMGGKVGLLTVSKSGSTAETASLMATAHEYLTERAGLAADRTVAITEPGSKLSVHAESLGWKTLPMRPKVGGRYSVLSHVGLFPLAYFGIGIESLLAGASAALEDAFSEDLSRNAAMAGALFLYEGSAAGRNIVDHFFFADSFESVGKWYRQLLAESVGKEFALDGSRVNAGLTPTTSIGSTDLHSVGQLYLGGPHDKSFVFVRTRPASELPIPDSESLDAVVPHIAGRPLSALMDAIFEGTAEAYRSKGIPFVEWTLKEGSAFDLGYFLQTKMCEVAFAGALFGVNPFDQPNVEDYKVGTKRILAEGK